MFLFDTSAVIHWLKGDPTLKDIDEEIGISAITAYELLWTSSKRKEKVKSAVTKFIESTVVVDVSLGIAHEGAKVKMKLIANGKDKPMADILIAATAKVMGVPIFTFDKDFLDILEVMELDLRLN